MTRNIISVNVDDDIATAARLMIEKGVGSVIVKKKDTPIGIITKKDIVERVVLYCHNPCKVKVKEIVTNQLVTISEKELIREALIQMHTHKIKRLPVRSEESGNLVGIITSYDIIAAFNTLELPEKSSKSI